MKKISGSTFYFKIFFPTVWFGFLGVFLFEGLTSGAISNDPMFLVVPVFMAIIGYFMMGKLVWDLADEVYDEREALLFRKGGKEQRVFLRDVVNVRHTQLNSPERITLNVRSGGEIGSELVFCPPLRLIPFGRNPLVVELIERIDRARNT